jgi:hypothetical protein
MSSMHLEAVGVIFQEIQGDLRLTTSIEVKFEVTNLIIIYKFLYVSNAFGSCTSDISRDIRRFKINNLN